MKDLLIALYALVALFRSEVPFKEATQALRSPNLKKFFPLIPGLQATINDVLRGEFNYEALGNGLAEYLKVYGKDPNSRASIRALLTAFARWMRTDSPVALKILEKNSASSVFPTWAGATFASVEQKAQGPVRKKMALLIKKMTGESKVAFTSVEEAKAAAANYPDVYKQYNLLRREFTGIWKGFLSDIVRNSGKKTLPYQFVLKEMQKADIDHNLPEGFTGEIDAVGTWYSQFGEALNKNPGANMFPTVRMNPKYKAGSGEWVFIGMKADGSRGNPGYAQAQVRERVDKKFAKVRDFVPVIDKVRRNWLKEVKSFDPTNPDAVACLVLELLFQTSARIGHFSAIRRKHYSPIVGGFQLKYQGKDNVATKHKYKGVDPLSKFIVGLMAGLAEGKKPDDFLFTSLLKNGGFRRVQAGLIRKKFAQLGATGVTVHKIRTYNGTKIFRSQMEKVFKNRTKLTPKEGMDILKKMATVVGKELNHVRTAADGTTVATPATALSAYIDLLAQVEFFQHYGLPLPKYLERFAKDPDSAEAEENEASLLEAALLAAAPKPVKKVKKEEVPEPLGKDDAVPEPEEDSEEEPEEEKTPKKAPNAPEKTDKKPEVEPEVEPEGENEDELSEEEAIALRLELGEQATKVADYALTGGEGHDIYQDDPGQLDNLLVENRFPKGEAP